MHSFHSSKRNIINVSFSNFYLREVLEENLTVSMIVLPVLIFATIIGAPVIAIHRGETHSLLHYFDVIIFFVSNQISTTRTSLTMMEVTMIFPIVE